MIRAFEQNESSFEEVVDYLSVNTDIVTVLRNSQDDSPIIFYTDDTRREGTEARLEELFETLELERIRRSSTLAPGSFFLEYDHEMYGLGPSSVLKGFAYLVEPPQAKDMFSSLDNLPIRLPQRPLYRPLQANWYLYIYYID